MNRYNDPVATLREWAAAIRTANPDAWNDLEDLAQSFETALAERPTTDSDDVRKALELVREGKRTGDWDEDDTDAVREALKVVREGVNPALELLECGTLEASFPDAVISDLMRAACKAGALDFLVDVFREQGVPCDVPAYDASAADKNLPALKTWARAVAEGIAKRLEAAETTSAPTAELDALREQLATAERERDAAREELAKVREQAARAVLVVEAVRAAVTP